MLKARKIENGISIYDSKLNDSFDFDKTSWEIIKLIKKHGKEKAIQETMNLFKIDEENAREDINTILNNLKALKIKLEEIPSTVSNIKYAPRTIHFDITTKCNSKCIYCYATDRLGDVDELSTQQILKLLDEMAELDTWTIMLSGGEPFLKKDFLKILGHLEKLGILVSILTNGMLITDSIARRLASFKNIGMIQVSLDSYIPEHHDLHRGVEGAYEKTLAGIKNLKKYDITPHIEIVITSVNLNDIDKTIELLYKLGIKVVTIGPVLTNTGRGCINKKKLILNKELFKSTGEKIRELNKKYNDSMCITPTREFFAYSTKKSVPKKEIKCGVGKSILYISPDGLVYPCFLSVYPESLLGDVKKESLSHIWKNSTLLKELRELNSPDIEKCKTCDLKHIYDLIVK